MVDPTRTTRTTRSADRSLPTLVTELWELVVAYAKQETVQPLKNLGRFVAAGVAGSVLLSIGLVLLVLAALRALQTETGDLFSGRLSFVPYLITLVLCALFAFLAVRSIGKEKREARR